MSQENVVIEIESFTEDLINYLQFKDLNPISVFNAWKTGLITIARTRPDTATLEYFPYAFFKGKPSSSTRLTYDELRNMFYTDFREISHKALSNLRKEAKLS